MISIGADVLYAAVNADSPDFEKARALVGRLGTSTEVVLSEQTLIALYGALARKGAAEAASVIRYFRRNPNWRVVDAQSSRLEMNAIWDSVFAGGEDLPSIRRRRLVMTLQRNGVTKFLTGEAAIYRKLGCAFAEDPFGG